MSAHNGFGKRLWLHMLREGGRWTALELRDELAQYAYVCVSTELRRMAARGTVDRMADGRYGVTATCAIPRGVTLNELRGFA